MKKGRAEPRIDVLQTVCTLFKLTLDDILLKDISTESTNYITKRRNLKLETAISEITFVPIKAAAGYLTGYADPEFIDELNTFTLPMLTRGHYRAFEIIGDSMLPTPSGSVIVGEKQESIEDVKTDSACIVVSKHEGIVYKRVQKNNKQKNKITLVSDNPSFHPYTIQTDDILELWKAQIVITKTTQTQRWDISQIAHVVSDLQNQVVNLKKKLN